MQRSISLTRAAGVVTAAAALSAGVLTAAPPAAAAQKAPRPTLSVDVGKYTTTTNPTQWGHIVEDISHSVEGGLNANLVRNSTMKENGTNPPAYWSLATKGGGNGSIATVTGHPLNKANKKSLKLTVGNNGPGQSVGVVNSGFYGVGLKPSTSYKASLYARVMGYSGPLTVSLQSTSGKVYASAKTAKVTKKWRKYTVNLSTSAKTPRASNNRVVIDMNGAGAGARVWMNVVRVLPPTYGSSGVLRTDLMQKMAATKPGFFRVPGGNYLEGQTLATRFAWKKTIGPAQKRPGHQNDAWGYWSTDQVGLKGYLDMADQSGAEPLLAVFAGYTLNHTVVPKDQLGKYVQNALDEIQYVTGGRNTKWGAKRARDGHPKPYPLHYVEIGNEDAFDGSGSYNNYRFPMFYDAIKRAYPKLQIVASTPVTSRTPDVIDEHFYNNNPAGFTAMAHRYDSRDRNAPKVLVGEYGITNSAPGNPTGNLAGAIGEAGFMTGMLRNADLVIGASFAPVLANVNSFQWPANLIGFDANSSYGSPSYYVQQMFGANKGKYVLPTTFSGVDSSISYVATRGTNGKVYVHVVNPTSTAVKARVNLDGANAITTSGTQTQLTGDPTARNSIADPTKIAPKTRSFRSSSRFGRTFPANSVTELTVSVSGAMSPALRVDKAVSFGVTTPNYTDRSLAVDTNGVGVTKVVTTKSSPADRKSATFFVRTGLSNKSCYSLESRSNLGQYLRANPDKTVTVGKSDGSKSFNRDATFCATDGHSGPGISLESAAYPGRFLRHYDNTLYVASNGGPNAFDKQDHWTQDTTFLVNGSFWRSTADVTLGAHSFRATTPGFTDSYLTVQNGLGELRPASATSPAADRQSATFTLVPGLADDSCYSFESTQKPGSYLRHQAFRVKLAAKDGTSLFASDATFCAQPGHNGTGISWQAIGFPTHYLRHFEGDVWVASNGGNLPSDQAYSWANDTSWTTEAPLAGSGPTPAGGTQ